MSATREILSLLTLALLGCPSGMEQMESGYRYDLPKFDEIASRVEPTKRAEIMQQKAVFEAEYARLPTDPNARDPALASLNQRINAYQHAMEAYAEQAQASANAAQAQAAMAQRGQLVATIAGNWSSPEMRLSVSPQGMVAYERNSGGTTRSVNAPITRIDGSGFDVGLMGMTTTFVIQAPPHQDATGAWQMTVDGVVLTRSP